MQTKRRKGWSLPVLRGMMLGSIVLLSLFMSYWLHTRFGSEREALQQSLNAKLESTRAEISDSVLTERIMVKPATRTKARNHVLAAPAGNPIRIRNGATIVFKITDNDSHLPPPLLDDHLKVNGAKREVSYFSQSDTPDKMVIRSFGSMLERTGLFSDSFHLLLSVGDSAVVRQAFQKKLRAEGHDFIVHALDKTLSDSSHGIVLHLRPDKQMLIEGYQPYLLRRITPDMLFAVLLLGIISGAFWLSLRSIRRQMMLSLVRNELVSNMSHELKTPVTTVKVALEALRDEEVQTNPTMLRDYADIAALEVSRLELLINQTLHNSLLEEGKLLMQAQPLDIRLLAEELARSMSVRFAQQSATLRLHFEGTSFIAAGDKLHLQGVLLNVLDNALKYGGARVKVEMALRERPGDIEIAISDNGPGIPAAYHRQVFQKFFRVPAHNLHNVKGYGLGLSYAAQVVQQHSGSMRVESGTDGGCTFFIILPKSVASS